MENKNSKRVLSLELDDNVKKVPITGIDSDEKVVMRQELSEDDLEQATGGLAYLIPTEVLWPNDGTCPIFR